MRSVAPKAGAKKIIKPMRHEAHLGWALILLCAASCDAAEEAGIEVGPTPPAGVQLVFDDFETIDPNWITGELESGVIWIADGELRMRNLTESGVSLTAIYDDRSSGQIIDVDVKLVAGTDDNWQTILCRNQGNSYYDLGISADGYYLIDIWVDGEKLDKSLGPTASSHILTGTDVVNAVHVECIGDRLSLSVNGSLIAELNDTSLTNGSVGLSVNALSDEFSEVAFDNFRLAVP